MSSNLRVALVQFAPMIGQVEQNIQKANKICSRIQPGSVDLVCLPEMILTGYAFPDSTSISPYLEHPRHGPTSKFCEELSKRLQAYVIAGFPERLSEDEAYTKEDGTQIVGANSSVIFGRAGEKIGEYRKSNLFYVDKSWAKAGSDFTTFSLPEPIGALSLGICMDLNPFSEDKWSYDSGPFELASYCTETSSTKPRTRVLVILCAWLDQLNDDNAAYNTNVLNYWTSRLKPLWDDGNSDTDSDSDSSSDAEDAVARLDANGDHQVSAGNPDIDETIVIVCNRCGEENGYTFTGSSVIFRFSKGKRDIVGVMKRKEEGVRVWTVETA